MNNDKLKIADNIFKFLVPFLLFLTPLFFLTFTPDFFGFNKMYLVFVSSLIILGVFFARNIVNQKAVYHATPLDLPIFLFLLAILLSTFAVSSNRWLPLWNRTGIILSLTLLYFALTQIKTANLRLWLQALFASSFILSWIAVFSYMQFLGKILPWEFVKSQLFNPTGSLISFVAFQAILLPGIIYFGLKTNQFLNKLLYFLVAALALISSIMVASLMLPGKQNALILLPYSTGWWIAVEIFKNAKSAFLGVGPESFLSAFTQYKPAAFNTGDLWTLRFTSSSNEVLHILTTLGVIGLATFIYLIVRTGKILLKNVKKDDFNFALKLSLFVCVLSFILIPANFLSLFLFYILIILIARQISSQKEIESGNIVKIFSGLVIILMLVVLYFAVRVYRGEVAFAQALLFANQNKGLETYNKETDAIRLNPFQEKYRTSFSQVNLALANSLAGKENLSDQDRQNITQLISQSIDEAKAAAAMDPTNVTYWENLASIYRTLINFANGSDQWAIASYAQAINLDPANPSLRVDLGGLFYGLGDYDSAIDQFRRAIDLKTDLANAYYNLSWAYRQKQDPAMAYQAMQQVLSLIPQDTEDFIKATQELEQLRVLLPETAQTATAAASQREQVLTPPPALPTPPPAGQINLPEEAAPEMPSPEPSPEESANPEANISPNPEEVEQINP